MKRTIATVALAGLLAFTASCVQRTEPMAPQPARVDEVRVDEAKQAQFGAVLDELIPGMAAEQTVDRETPQQAFEDLCLRAGRPGAADERLALCTAILARLGPGTAQPARVWMLRQLANIGGAESVATLAELRHDADPQIRELSRRALQHNAAPAAADALREELQTAGDSASKIALINALAARRDLASVPLFAEIMRPADGEVAEAILAGLGEVGTTAAIRELERIRTRVPADLRARADSALLRCAEERHRAGDAGVAFALYEGLQESGATDALRTAGLYGMVMSRGEKTIPLLLEHINGDDPRRAATAARFAERVPGADTTRKLVEAFTNAAPAAQALLLGVFEGRGDPAARATALAAAESDDERVRIAALRALRKLGDDSCVPLLAQAAAGAGGAERDAARDSLSGLAGPTVDATILAALREPAEPAVRCELIRSLAERRCGESTTVLLAATEDADESVRVAAFNALGTLAAERDLPALVEHLVRAQGDGAREAAENAVVDVSLRIGDSEKRADAVLAAIGDTAGTVKAALVRVLGRIGGAKALEALRAARQSEDADVLDAAVRALANWPDVAVADDLLDIARAGANETHTVLALRGYVRLVRLPSEREPLATFTLLEEALSLASRPDEKKLVLGGLAEIAHVRALEATQASLDDEALREEAGVATLRIAKALAATEREAALAAIEQVRTKVPDAASQSRVAETVAFLERHAGYSAAWLVAGPYVEQGKNSTDLFAVPFSPELPDAADVEWTPLAVNNPEDPWVFDLLKALGGHNRCVYVKTMVWSKNQQPARLDIGSDDAVKVWLNGELVHSHLVYRLANPGDDQVQVALNEGWNTLMMKIVQGGGGWGFCAGFCTPDGQPLANLRFDSSPQPADQ